MHCSGNVRDLRLVVGEYNIVLTENQLHSVLHSLEVCIFHNDRGQWYTLAEHIRLAFRRRQIVIQRGRSSCKWLLFACVDCGNYLFVNQSGVGQYRFATPADEAARRHISEFFNWPTRVPTSQIRHQV